MPTVKCQKAEWDGLSCSLLARLNRSHRALDHLIMLEIQYRMHPDIQRFPNIQFYGGALKCCLRTVPEQVDGIPWPKADKTEYK